MPLISVLRVEFLVFWRIPTSQAEARALVVKCQGQGNPKPGHSLVGLEWMESSPVEGELQVLLVEILTMNLHCQLAAQCKNPILLWAASRAVWAAG